MTSSDTKAPRLVLVDASSYLYRAFHAMPDLRTSTGQATGAIYGVLNMVRKLRADYAPQALALVFDAKGPTFRDTLYGEYKATREAMPDDLVSQIQGLHETLEAQGLPVLAVPGFEADDVIGTLAVSARAAGYEVIISTGDKDMAQLVEPGVVLVNTMTGVTLDGAAVAERFGVTPARIVDFLTLTGDKVDNVPGVPGVGPKTAAKWLGTYGSLEGILAHRDELPGAAGQALREAAPRLALSRELVTIRRDVPLPVALAGLVPRDPDRERLRALYRQFEFKTWLAELGPAHSGAVPAAAVVLRDPAAIQAWCAAARDAGSLVVDLWFLERRALALAFGAGDAAAVVPFGDFPAGATVPPAGPVRALLEQGPPKIVHDGKYLQRLLALEALTPVEDDLMLAAYVLDSGAADYTLGALSLKYLGERLTTMEELCGRGRTQVPFHDIDDAELARIAAARVHACRALREVFSGRLTGEGGLRFVYREIELPLSPVLARIEANGVAIDREMLARQGALLEERMHALEKEAWDLAQNRFNLNSPSQIQQILFVDLKLPVKRRTPKGQPSTAEEVLAELALDYPLPQRILDYRALGKLKSTYVDKLPQMCDAHTGRIHTTYHQAVAATGRLSSSDPNLQNIPIRTEEGRRVRRAFVAAPGFSLLAADYSQIELRLMAHLSEDAGLVRAFREGRDVHRATAAEVFGVPLADVTADQRRAAKAINFGLMYGMSAYGLARQLKISQSDAQDYCDLYFARYPGVRAYMEAMRRAARDQGYVETLFGRRLYVPDIKASNTARRQYAERTAINAPLQGTAADLIKRAMLKIDAFMTKEALKSRMIMQVHDELVFEVWPPEQAVLQPAVVAHMSQAATLMVPLVVECGMGANWDEAH